MLYDTILQGDALATLRTLPDACVQCVVTSPPYWGLRDYGVPGQFGLERTPDEYVARMVEVFREVRRVLRDDGTCWLNLGDSYTSGNSGQTVRDSSGGMGKLTTRTQSATRANCGRRPLAGMKPKDLIGMPWRVAFALQADGWWLRADIIWHKPNPMPESIADRPTKAHEYLFLLTKSARYYYDAAAIRDPVTGGSHPRAAGRNSRKYVDRDPAHIYTKMPDGWDTGKGAHGSYHRQGREKGRRVEMVPGVTPKSAEPGSGIKANASFHAATTQLVMSRNKRSVWTVATAPFPEAHFATFPPALIEPCILAGAPTGGLVLDPFMGAGTVGVVCRRHSRRYLGIELNPAYVAMAEKRIADEVQPVLWTA